MEIGHFVVRMSVPGGSSAAEFVAGKSAANLTKLRLRIVSISMRDIPTSYGTLFAPFERLAS